MQFATDQLECLRVAVLRGDDRFQRVDTSIFESELAALQLQGTSLTGQTLNQVAIVSQTTTSLAPEEITEEGNNYKDRYQQQKLPDKTFAHLSSTRVALLLEQL